MNKDNKMLIILTPGFARDETDTACLPFLQNLIKESNKEFPLLKIIILAFDYPFMTAEYQWHNNEIISFNGWGKKRFKKLFKWLLIWIKMRRIKRSNHVIGILSLWCNECAYLGSRFARRNNLPHFCWILGQDAKKENKYIGRIRPFSEELIAISDFIQEEFEKNHAVRPKYVVPIGIPTNENLNENFLRHIDILGVGSFIQLKQYHLFIEAVYEIRRHFINIRAVLCGKGPEENNLKKMIEKYGLQNNISLTGELPHDEILRIMNQSKVLLHTSKYEGLPAVCIEALYAGCHVISFVQPVHNDIEHWHIAHTKEQLAEKARIILSNHGTLYKPVLTFTIGESVKKIMHLYNYNESTTN